MNYLIRNQWSVKEIKRYESAEEEWAVYEKGREEKCWAVITCGTCVSRWNRLSWFTLPLSRNDKSDETLGKKAPLRCVLGFLRIMLWNNRIYVCFCQVCCAEYFLYFLPMCERFSIRTKVIRFAMTNNVVRHNFIPKKRLKWWAEYEARVSVMWAK